MYQTAVPEGGAMRVYLTHAEGMTGKNGPEIKGFEVAGADGKFAPASAKVEGNTILVASASVTAPVSVRYGWADDPGCNLINQAGLPAVPFRNEVPRYAW